MTPHIEANKGDYAPIVLMPGDPLRAKWIAETFLSDIKLVNSVRNCLGYTGKYKGKEISVQASGMGQASLGIYTHELYNFYNVDNIIRVGSCGGIAPFVEVNDIIVAMTSSTDTGMTSNLVPGFSIAPVCDYTLMHKFIDNIPASCTYHVGSITSNDWFYQPNIDWWKPLADLGVLAVEMETHVLYTQAMRFNKKALSVNTVSDLLRGGTELSAKERATTFNNMIEAVLESIS